MTPSVLVVNERVRIPRSELTVRASRSGGPGGQHVNTSSTRIEVTWNPTTSAALDEASRARLVAKLGKRVDGRGNVRVVGSSYRSQARNREEAEERLAALIRRALAVPRSRKPTRPTRTSVEKRLQSKHRQSERKRERRVRDFD
jgi:ribosome-associated protein